ncbi:ABC transporter ATP-binding protein [Desulfospira joergensenii]|uniref:ABC transporter ATP-binding protein n=1 Tax=Desulfospira joergensenii TaxID=53329 RepID=UPI0003B401F0|nr:ABC transporter ATP-binding protein [Desulfospira joergensenii]
MEIPTEKTEPPGESLLSIRNLKTYFHVKEGLAKAVDGVSYDIGHGETLGLVGESGCGKTVSALSILKLLDVPPAEYHSGQILFRDQDLLKMTEDQMNAIRGRSISMIFQEPMTSLNPLLSIGFQIDEVMVNHLGLSPKQARERTVELLDMVGIPLPRKRAKEYPHQLSGGMRQRIMIALALACDPELLIADEPTTALDVTIQAQILDIMLSLQERFNTSILLITHDLGVIAETAHRVAVMYAGRIVEEADVKTLFKNPLHPYTRGLLRSVPNINRIDPSARLQEISGMVPNLCRLPRGCAFYNRCDLREERCRSEKPGLYCVENGHYVRCWLHQTRE